MNMSANDKIGDNNFWDLSQLVNRKDPAPTTFSPTVRLATVSDGENEVKEK